MSTLLSSDNSSNTYAPAFSRERIKTGSVARLGEILCRKAELSYTDLGAALEKQQCGNVRLGTLLVANGLVNEDSVLTALSEQFGAPIADFESLAPNPFLQDGLTPELCLKFGVMPWYRDGTRIVLATSRPETFHLVLDQLPAKFAKAEMAIASHSALQRQIAKSWSGQLTSKAEQACPKAFSCRTWAKPLGRPLVFAVFVGLIALAVGFPAVSVRVIYCWVIINLLSMTALRLTALALQLRILRQNRNSVPKVAVPERPSKLPKVSVLVPLYGEERVLPRLIERLAKTDYPLELLEICLVLEETDKKTLKAVQSLDLPPWMRVINVPGSRLKTKPRAMNYALDFCTGDIIGIYDAEDAPEIDQISRIVAKFARSGPEVACVQAYLDYYNPKQNWLSRCFTIEYAIWFRLVLQGVERMRLPVPLGGTSVFFRREALEKIGAWDAHNVTEDADLGMRLARFGYRCAFEPTTTYEEANCHTLAWVKQRSRWLKGYAMTWITHMRQPRALWRDLGPKGFLTFHVILLGTLSSFLLAPAIWSFWLIAFGFTPVFAPFLPDIAWSFLGKAFVASEILLAVLGFVATSGKGHRFLMPWVPTMVIYWPLGTIAAYKAMYEVLLAPFYWDKTSHGLSKTDT